jgi:hypothetical protein
MMISHTVLSKLHKSLFILAFVFLNQSALAQEDEPQTLLSWKTELKEVINEERKVQILWTSSQEGILKLKKSQIFHLSPNKKVQTLSSDKFSSSFPLDLKQGQAIEMTLLLPAGLIQMPVSFETKDGQAKSYVLALKVDLSSGQIQPQALPTQQRMRDVFIWAGLGATFLNYTQNSDVITNEVSFATLELPSLSFLGELGLTENFTFSSFLNLAPGQVEGSPQLSFDQQSYYWIIYGIEGVHLPNFLAWKRLKLGYRFGVQMHQIPFIQRTTTNNVVDIETNAVGNLSFGPMLSYQLSEHWKFQSYVRFQYTVFSGSLFEPSADLNFDGNVGLFWKPYLKSNWSYSVQWYGQSQSFSYTHTDILLQGDSLGTLDLFFTGVDLRLGYQF